MILAVAAAAFAAAPAAPAPALDLTAFFTGRTHAENVMKVAFKRSAQLVVDSFGRRDERGEFILVDTVHEDRKPVRMRKWVMRSAGPNRFTGTLSDATGPVEVTVNGRAATIRYTMSGGLRIVQQLELLGDGRTLSNRVVARKFGIRFASIDGKIRKLD